MQGCYKVFFCIFFINHTICRYKLSSKHKLKFDFVVIRRDPIPAVGSARVLPRASRGESLQRSETHLHSYIQHIYCQLSHDRLSVSHYWLRLLPSYIVPDE